MTKPVTLEELDGMDPSAPGLLLREQKRLFDSYRLALAVVEAARSLMDAPPECRCKWMAGTCTHCSRWRYVMKTLAAFDKGTTQE